MTDHYTYRLTWSAEDQEYVGLCAEFPSLSWLASTQEKAFSGIRRLVAESIADMQANNEQSPKPLADRSYSGKFMVRVPPETHRALAIRAAEEGVSLNRLVSARLANDLRKRQCLPLQHQASSLLPRPGAGLSLPSPKLAARWS